MGGLHMVIRWIQKMTSISLQHSEGQLQMAKLIRQHCLLHCLFFGLYRHGKFAAFKPTHYAALSASPLSSRSEMRALPAITAFPSAYTGIDVLFIAAQPYDGILLLGANARHAFADDQVLSTWPLTPGPSKAIFPLHSGDKKDAADTNPRNQTDVPGKRSPIVNHKISFTS